MRVIKQADKQKAVKNLRDAVSSRNNKRLQKLLQSRPVQQLVKPDDYNGKIRHLKRKAKERK